MYECSVFHILEIVCLRWREADWIVDQEVYSYIEPMLTKYFFFYESTIKQMSHLLHYDVHTNALQGQPCLLNPFLCKPLQGNF